MPLTIRHGVLLIAALPVAACSQSKGDKALREYEIATKSPVSKARQCELSKKVADGYLADENQAAYDSWRVTASVNCMQAQMKNW